MTQAQLGGELDGVEEEGEEGGDAATDVGSLGNTLSWQHAPATQPITTHFTDISCQHNRLTHPIKTHRINPSYRPTLSTSPHPIKPHYQHSLSTHPINPYYQHTLSSATTVARDPLTQEDLLFLPTPILSTQPINPHPINLPPTNPPLFTTMSTLPTTATTVARDPLTQEDLLFGRELPRGRLYITCIEGEEMRKAHETGKQGQRIDPYIKFRLGAAERLPFYNTAPTRKQDKDPSFENEVTHLPPPLA